MNGPISCCVRVHVRVRVRVRVCWQVGAFDSNSALEVIERDLGGSIEELFEEFSAEPIASASLGQVYRGRLRGMASEVAVKVQVLRVRERACVRVPVYYVRMLDVLTGDLLRIVSLGSVCRG